jgi:hypothetical protein
MLDTGHRVTTVREEVMPLLPSATDLSDIDWSADQYTQETIAVDLAEQGWEAFGVAADEGPRQIGRLGTSATYLVRRAGSPQDSLNNTETSR